MGLVVLSVFALAFVACGNSDSGEPSNPNVPGGIVTGPTPNAAAVYELPAVGRGGAPVYEGQEVDLTGLILNVRYTDNTSKPVAYPAGNWTVSPSIYIYNEPAQVYTVTYTENLKTVSTTISFSNVRRLLDLDVTGQLTTQDYLIDDIPKFAGVVVYGVYSDTISPPLSVKIPDDSGAGYAPPGWAQMADYKRALVPLTEKNPDYKWAWVHNKSPASGSFQPNDSVGVLVSIGSYGHILSKIEGAGVSVLGTPENGYTGTDYLTGKRIEITNLWQVEKIEVTGTWKDIFYDDPTLIGAVETEEALRLRMDKWIDNLQNAQVIVTYNSLPTPTTRTYNLKELQAIGYAYADYISNVGWGGTWANLDVFPVSRATKRIDVTKDSKLVLGATDTGIVVNDFNWLDKDKGDPDPAEAATSATIYGDGGWAQWAQLNYGQSRMGFWWRGRPAYLMVPIYNRPAAITATPKAGVPVPTVMNGGDKVYRPPEGMWDFLNKFTVKVDYTRSGEQNGPTGSRPDVVADIKNGTCRAFVIGDLTYRSPSYPANIDYDTKFSSLFSLTVFNMQDNSAKVGRNVDPRDKWTFDYDNKIAQATFANGVQPESETIGISILTKAQSDRFASRGTPINATISYTGWAGNPSQTRTVRTPNIQVGVTNYAYDFATLP